MLTLILALVLQILKDQGLPYNGKEFDKELSKICRLLRKSKKLSLNLSEHQSELSNLLVTMFRSDYIKNKQLVTKQSITKRIAKATANLGDYEFSVLRDGSGLLIQTASEEYKEEVKLRKNGFQSREEQIMTKFNGNFYFLGRLGRLSKKLFKYDDLNKILDTSRFKISGLDELNAFEMALDMYANGMIIELPIDVKVIINIEDLFSRPWDSTGTASGGVKPRPGASRP